MIAIKKSKRSGRYMNKLILLALLLNIMLSCENSNNTFMKTESEKSKNITMSKEEENIKKKTYFAFVETIRTFSDMINMISFNDLKNMDYKGTFNIDNFSTSSLIYKESKLHGYSMIDPFLKGNLESTIVFERPEFRFDKDEPPVFNETMKGSHIHYITNKEDTFLLIFAGPDEDIDNYDFDFQTPIFRNKIKPWHVSVSFLPSNWIIPKINHPDLIQYDPTNGLYSNGDIIWPINIQMLVKYDEESDSLKIGKQLWEKDAAPIAVWTPLYDLTEKD